MRLGVIGGMGPLATARYLELMSRMTDARTDQDHLEMIVMNIPTIPDRTACLLGQAKGDPLKVLIQQGSQLKEMGAGLLSMPCITAQHYREAMEQQLNIPILDPISGGIKALHRDHIQTVGLLATTGTVSRGMVQNKLESSNIQTIVPASEEQEALMDLIYRQIKAGLPGDKHLLDDLCRSLRNRGAQTVLLGCTELSLMSPQVEGETLDLLEVLARESVLACGKSLRNC